MGKHVDRIMGGKEVTANTKSVKVDITKDKNFKTLESKVEDLQKMLETHLAECKDCKKCVKNDKDNKKGKEQEKEQ